MGKIEDMTGVTVMAEPVWPRCGHCSVDLVERKDPRTGRIVRSRGRDLLACPKCHELTIAPSPRKMRSRYRKIRILALGSAAAAGMVTLVVEAVRMTGMEGLTVHLLLVLFLAASLAVTVHCMLEAVLLAMSPQNKGNVRFESGFLAMFWAVALGLLIWLAVRVFPDIWKEPGKAGAGPEREKAAR